MDSKTTAIWILSIALVIVGFLWLRAESRPKTVEEFSSEIASKAQQMQKDCADTSSDSGRNACIQALENVKISLGQFFGTGNPNATSTP